MTEILTISILKEIIIHDLNGTLQSVYSMLIQTLSFALVTWGLVSDHIFHAILAVNSSHYQHHRNCHSVSMPVIGHCIILNIPNFHPTYGNGVKHFTTLRLGFELQFCAVCPYQERYYNIVMFWIHFKIIKIVSSQTFYQTKQNILDYVHISN